MADYGAFFERHLKGIKWRSGGEGAAKCRFHEDRKASLSINRDNGLWFCHACSVGGTARDFAERLGIEAPAGNRKSAEYAFDYRDEQGALLFQVVRFPRKEFRQRRPDGKGEWIWNLTDVRRVPYRLPELLKSKGNVFIVEGEKDVETIRAQGFTATCNSAGARKWREEYGEFLRGRVCILIADNDEPGRKHVEDVARDLAPYAEKIIDLGVLPDSPEHGDVTDWIAAGHTAADLLALVDRAEAADSKLVARGAAESQWPAPMADAAFHGPAGEFVRLVEPHTEADPAGLLLQFLVAAGSWIGHSPYRLAGAQAHHLNEFTVLVGESKQGRKGTSLAEVERFFQEVDPDWLRERKASGLTSGEGLIWHVRDPIIKRERKKEDGKLNADYDDVEVDAGVGDKRLLAVEKEFGRTLKACGRDGNTLSAMLREAWDGGNLATLTKSSPARASDAHITLIGHITPAEIGALLDSTDAANGFGNRILWCSVRRSKTLPWGGSTQDKRLGDLVFTLQRAGDEARRVHEFEFDGEAKALWEQGYPALSGGKTGLLGAMVARSEAHVVRLACIYAALDRSGTITVAHLKAALAVWEYCERSAEFIFGARMGNPIADAIVDALTNTPEGLTRTDIRDLFARNRGESEIEGALALLRKSGRAMSTKEPSGGRPVERWKLRV
jgi:hypothetical protein